METNIEIMTHEEFGQVRIICEKDTFLFCGVDVAKALGYSNPWDALQRHCKSGGLVKHEVSTLGTNQYGAAFEKKETMTFITEGNVYRLITGSKLPAAEKFEHWVFDEVLPSIRKHGGYMRDDLLQAAMRDPTVLLELAEALVAEKRRNDALTAENAVLGEKAVFFDAFVDIQSTTNIRNTAKELGVPEKFFVRFLLGEGYMYRCPAGNLMPYNKPKCKGLFAVKDFIRNRYSGSYTLITPEGKLALRDAISELPNEKVKAYAGWSAFAV